jgi:uncharacterized protein YlxW (UPF0749 family)
MSDESAPAKKAASAKPAGAAKPPPGAKPGTGPKPTGAKPATVAKSAAKGIKAAAKTPSKTAAATEAPRKSTAQPPAPPTGPTTAASTAEAPAIERPASEAPAIDAPERPSPLRVLLEAGRPRASRGQFVAALLCGLLGFGLVTQVHSAAGSGFTTARQSDLVDILDSLSARSDQLRAQIATEQAALAKLTGGTDSTQAALQEAQQRASTLQILAGTAPASGPGIDLQITDPEHQVGADVLLDTLEELRDAGAEAIEITGSEAAANTVPTTTPAATAGTSGSAVGIAPSPTAVGIAPSPTAQAGAAAHTVRLVASSYFVDAPGSGGVVVDGVTLAPPYDIVAIGDPHTMTTAMGIPGGVLDTLTGKNAHGTVVQHDAVQVTALHQLTAPQYARPASSSSAGG